MTLLDAMDDPNLFGPWFKQRKHVEGLARFMTALFAHPHVACRTGDLSGMHPARPLRHRSQSKRLGLRWAGVGARASCLALVAIISSLLLNYRRYLAPGERGTVMIIAADRKQARVILRLCAWVSPRSSDVQGHDRARNRRRL